MTVEAPAREHALPQDIDAEQCVLGAMLLSRDAITDAIDVLHGGEFYRPAHNIIYSALLAMYAKGEPADPITLAAHLQATGDAARCGGPVYLHDLVRAVPTAANVDYYAHIVRGHAVRRRLIDAGNRIAQMGYTSGAETAELLDAAGHEFNAAITTRENGEAATIGEGFEQYMDQLEALQNHGRAKGVPTGFADLDSLTGGLHPGQMVIVAARPAIGKSTLGLDMARACAIKHQRPAAFFSLEMSRGEVMDRVMSAEARIGLHHLRHKGGMTDDDWARFARAVPRISSSPLTIDATPEQTVMGIKAACRRLQQRDGLDLVVIDYLQLLRSGHTRRVENRQVEVAQMSRDIKLMAKELHVPVVVLAQLNRGPEQRQDKKPLPSDLRESGSLEQDADVVILLHREDAYDKESPRSGEADLIVGKHRNGPTATITVAAQLHYSRFADMAIT